LLLDALDLDDDAVLNDHPNLAVPDAFDGEPDLVQVDGGNGSGGRRSAKGLVLILSGKRLLRHTHLTTIAGPAPDRQPRIRAGGQSRPGYRDDRSHYFLTRNDGQD
jgi:hypothetical protein